MVWEVKLYICNHVYSPWALTCAHTHTSQTHPSFLLGPFPCCMHVCGLQRHAARCGCKWTAVTQIYSCQSCCHDPLAVALVTGTPWNICFTFSPCRTWVQVPPAFSAGIKLDWILLELQMLVMCVFVCVGSVCKPAGVVIKCMFWQWKCEIGSIMERWRQQHRYEERGRNEIMDILAE